MLSAGITLAPCGNSSGVCPLSVFQIKLITGLNCSPSVVWIFWVVVSPDVRVLAEPKRLVSIREPLQHRNAQPFPLRMLLMIRQLVNGVVFDDYRGVHDCRNLLIVATEAKNTLANQVEPLCALCRTHRAHVGLRIVDDDEVGPLLCAVRSLVRHASNATRQAAGQHNGAAGFCPLAGLILDRRQHQRILSPDDKCGLAVVRLASCSLRFVFQMKNRPAHLRKVVMKQVVCQ